MLGLASDGIIEGRMFKMSRTGFLVFSRGRIRKVKFFRSQPTSNPQKGRYPNFSEVHKMLKVFVEHVAVHAITGTFWPI